MPAGVTIEGIEVKLEGKVDNTSGTPKMYAELLGGWGRHLDDRQSYANVEPKTDTTYTWAVPPGPGSTTWSPGANVANYFRVRITNVASNTSRDFSLDWVAVQVTYQ